MGDGGTRLGPLVLTSSRLLLPKDQPPPPITHLHSVLGTYADRKPGGVSVRLLLRGRGHGSLPAGLSAAEPCEGIPPGLPRDSGMLTTKEASSYVLRFSTYPITQRWLFLK